MKILRGGFRKFLDSQKRGSEKIRGGRGSKNVYTLNSKGAGGLLKN